MATKSVHIDGVGTVVLAKSARNKAIRISVKSDLVRVSMPIWVTYATGVNFLTEQMSWVLEQQNLRPKTILKENQRVGRMHTLHFLQGQGSGKTRVTSGKILVAIGPDEHWDQISAQNRARKGAMRALKHEAEIILPPRVIILSKNYDLPYKSLAFKKLTRRWGSCDSHGNIVFNIFLMQVPIELIDYVICHELAHTKNMNHSSEFWSLVGSMCPNYKTLRKALKTHQTAL